MKCDRDRDTADVCILMPRRRGLSGLVSSSFILPTSFVHSPIPPSSHAHFPPKNLDVTRQIADVVRLRGARNKCICYCCDKKSEELTCI